MNRGHSERPLSHTEITEKFLENMRSVTDEATTQRVLEAVLDRGSDRGAREFALNCARG